MNILVSGGAGYIGSVLIGRLLDQGHYVTVLDNLMYQQSSLLSYCGNNKFDFICGDVCDEMLFGKLLEQSDLVIPLAAIVGFPACDRQKQLATDTNHRQILFITRNFASKKIIFPNTNSGYGANPDGVCTEESSLSPISHYGITKCAAEKTIVQNTDGIVLRLATVFGMSPRMRLDLLVNDFTYKAATDGYIVLFERNFRRNYVHVEDVVDCFLFMIENYGKCKSNVFNIGLSDVNLTKLELCQKIKEFIPKFSIQFDDIREDPDKRDYVVSNEKVEKYGWKAKRSVEQGIQELIRGYQMIKPLMKRCAND